MKISFDRLLTYIIIPFFLLFLWLTLSLFFTSKYSFSVIYSAYDRGSFTSVKTDELLAKQKISATFKAKENNLGIISVRFKTYSRINDDKVIFRLKEKGSKNWFYEYPYKVDQFQDGDYFTFGFPIISESSGKTYNFEIESTKGVEGNAVSISPTSPIFITLFQFTKQQLIANKSIIPAFFIKKIFYSFSDINFTISSLAYLLPFILYIVWCFLARPLIKINSVRHLRVTLMNWRISLIKKYRKKKYLLFYIYFFVIIILIFFMNVVNNYVYILLIGLWGLLIMIYRFESSVSYFLGLFFLLLCPVFLIINQESIAENAAIWAYFFLLIGTIEGMIEFKKHIKNLISYDVFLRQNLGINLEEKNAKKDFQKGTDEEN